MRTYSEIDEDLLSHQLTRLKQSRHIACCEAIMQARGARARVGENLYAGGSATVAGPLKTMKELARETGLAERTYRGRPQIGRSLTEETLDIL
jgi:hypothetical protein